MIALILMLEVVQLIACANIRLDNFGCFNSSNSPLFWNNPDTETQIKNLCSLIVTVKGFHNTETDNKIDETAEQQSDYQITALLSLTETPNLNSLADLIFLKTLSLANLSVDSEGMIEASLDSVILPAVEFCGESYLIAALQKKSRSRVSQNGLLSIPIQIQCAEDYIDLALVVSIPKIETVINFADDQQYLRVVANFKMNYSVDHRIWPPNHIQISVANNANQTFRERCGLFAVRLLSFLIPYNDSHWLPLGTDKRQFSSAFMKPNKKLLDYSVGSVIVDDGGKSLPSSRFGKCSPAIQPNERLAINMRHFSLNASIAEKLSKYSQLVTIIDPLNEINDYKRENNVFVLPLLFAESKNKIVDECVVQSDPVSGRSGETIILHRYHYSITKTYSYRSNEHMLTEIAANDAKANYLLKYYVKSWLISRRVDQLLARNECPKAILSKSILDEFLELLFNSRIAIIKLKSLSKWQRDQVLKMYLFLKVTRDTIMQFDSGVLSVYKKDILWCVKSRLNSSRNSQFNVKQIFNSIKKLIYNNELSENNDINSDSIYERMSNLIVKRVKKFVMRLLYEGVDAITESTPKLQTKKEFVSELKRVLEWIRDNSLFTFHLPLIVKNIIIQAIDSPPVNVSQLITNGIHLSENYLRKYHYYKSLNGDRVRESLVLLIRLLRTTLASNIWSSWGELFHRYRHLINNNKHFIIINGDLIVSKSDHILCRRKAIDQLMAWKSMPLWLNDNNETEDSYLTQSLDTTFDSHRNIIGRTDTDPISGYRFRSIVLLCECNSSESCR